MAYFSEQYDGSYISLAEAARRLDVTEHEVHERLDRGEIRGIEIGSTLFVNSTSLNASRDEPEVLETEVREPTGREDEMATEHSASSSEKEHHSGPGRFVFRQREAVTAVPLLVIGFLALFLAAPVYQERPEARPLAAAFFPTEENPSSPSVARYRSDQSNVAVQRNIDTWQEIEAENDSLMANALSGAAEAFRAFSRSLYEALGLR